jgi:hypothetical protein
MGRTLPTARFLPQALGNLELAGVTLEVAGQVRLHLTQTRPFLGDDAVGILLGRFKMKLAGMVLAEFAVKTAGPTHLGFMNRARKLRREMLGPAASKPAASVSRPGRRGSGVG